VVHQATHEEENDTVHMLGTVALVVGGKIWCLIEARRYPKANARLKEFV
jgi:hypothetical protein